MEYAVLSNGIKMPMLGYGVYQVTKDECERCVLDHFLSDSLCTDICVPRMPL